MVVTTSSAHTALSGAVRRTARSNNAFIRWGLRFPSGDLAWLTFSITTPHCREIRCEEVVRRFIHATISNSHSRLYGRPRFQKIPSVVRHANKVIMHPSVIMRLVVHTSVH